jgi:hypothetical protein
VNLSQQAKAEMQRNLAKRLKALGGDVGDVDTITHDERSLLRVVDAIIGRLEALAKVKA